MTTSLVSFKVSLKLKDSPKTEIRRFELPINMVYYELFLNKLLEVIPHLSGKSFTIYFKDEEGDEVAVKSREEFETAIHCHEKKNDPLIKFGIEVDAPSREERKNVALHPNIFCDVCGSKVAGTRYKCIICSDYDQCEMCATSNDHGMHPMLKIPDPALFSRSSLKKLIHVAESLLYRDRHRESKHCDDSGSPDTHKKRKKCDRPESTDTDDSEEGCRRKHSHFHKKLRKGKCPYNQIMSDVFTYLSPMQFLVKPEKTTGEDDVEESSNANYLRSVGKTLQTFLDPLGVGVDFEIRSKEAKKEEKETASEMKKKTTEAEAASEVKKTTETDAGSEMKKKKKTTTTTVEQQEKKGGTPTKTTSGQREVRFVDPQDEIRKKLNEITKLLEKQTMNETSSSSSCNGNGVDSEEWVEFEELTEETEEPRTNTDTNSSTADISKVSQQQQQEQQQQQTATALEENVLYPDLTSELPSMKPEVRVALQRMLAMGFKNEGNWLGQLLEAKDGNIEQALEALEPYSKHSTHP